MTIKLLSKYGDTLIQSAQKALGKNNSKIPKYLYHITTKSHYNSMLESGVIKTSKDVSPMSNLNGVFMFDMIAGRLELFPLLILFHPALWKDTLFHRSKDKKSSRRVTAPAKAAKKKANK